MVMAYRKRRQAVLAKLGADIPVSLLQLTNKDGTINLTNRDGSTRLLGWVNGSPGSISAPLGFKLLIFNNKNLVLNNSYLMLESSNG